MLTTLAISNYRSLRDLRLPLQALNVVTGPNGSGKSSVYRALRLLADIGQGRVIPSLAREGGLQSTLWAGPQAPSRAMKRGEHPVQGSVRQTPVSLRLGFASDDFGYAIDLGLPAPDRTSMFSRDPMIKSECLWSGPLPRPAALLADRHNALVRRRGDDGQWSVSGRTLASFDSMLTHLGDPQAAPELLVLRERMRSWRFYDHFRTDADAPARAAQVGTHTPVLGHDGADVAAALQTIREIGDRDALDAAIDDAFPGATLEILGHDGRFEFAMRQHGLLRALHAAELSDGTLRYLLWVAALLSPRPPELLVLNEPETSLHPDLLPALGRLVRAAARHSQVIVVSHAMRLIAALQEDPQCAAIVLEKDMGETRVVGLPLADMPAWRWPER